MSSNRYLSSKNRLFERLQQLDDILYLPDTTKDTVRFVKREFKFLDIFLSLQSLTDEPDMLDVTEKVQALFEDALVDFSELHLAEYFDFCTFMVQYKIWLIKMEIRAKYSFPRISLSLTSANKDDIAIPTYVTVFIDAVIDDLRDLMKLGDRHLTLDVPETKKHTDHVLRELIILQNFVYFVSERLIEPLSQHLNFFTHVLTVVGHASMLAWLYFSGHGYEDQDVALGEIMVLLFLQMKIKPAQPYIRKIYVDVLQSLKSTIQPGWYPNIQSKHAIDSEGSFTATILHNLVDLPTNSNSSWIVALKDHLAIFQEMLNFLRANVICVPIQDLQFLLQDIDTGY